ncbi:YwaF family protein [Paenibacillus oceani]|uniref:TIGR02206 family membrane protein n=1 Tax=Paenibacillus oceani TaxID=2772510 RepID=A0A927H238_9BACL|nr:TIGR02206 family membrane protein [Paenibacillus oceani]MBD2864857.1 TIGR02206 family membrane protein [Paenibacillus oceani]
MNRFLDANDPAGFAAYSASHLGALAVLVVLLLMLYGLRRWFRYGNRSRYGRYALAGVLALSEISLNVWYVTEDVYSVKDTLPLELCSITLYLCVFMLLFNSRVLFGIAYFTGIGGAMQALLTPVLYYDYPHFRFLEFFAAHIAILLAVFYMVWVERFWPTFRSVLLAMGFLNVLLPVILFVNAVTGGNYMFLSGKPETPSLLDWLGPYPWYLLSLEAAAFFLFLVLYVPFALTPASPAERQNKPG